MLPSHSYSTFFPYTTLFRSVKDIYGILGSAFMDMLDLLPTAGIRFVPVRHEQSSAHIADAYTRVSGVAGVVIGQNGPGVTNMVTDRKSTRLNSSHVAISYAAFPFVFYLLSLHDALPIC